MSQRTSPRRPAKRTDRGVSCESCSGASVTPIGGGSVDASNAYSHPQRTAPLSEKVAVLEERVRHLATKAWVWRTVAYVAGLVLVAIATFTRLAACAV